MSIKIISNEKYDGEGRPFGSANNPIKRLVLLLSTDGSTPSNYTDVEGLSECAFAPGSVLMDTSNSIKYIYNGTTWVEWG